MDAHITSTDLRKPERDLTVEDVTDDMLDFKIESLANHVTQELVELPSFYSEYNIVSDRKDFITMDKDADIFQAENEYLDIVIDKYIFDFYPEIKENNTFKDLSLGQILMLSNNVVRAGSGPHSSEVNLYSLIQEQISYPTPSAATKCSVYNQLVSRVFDRLLERNSNLKGKSKLLPISANVSEDLAKTYHKEESTSSSYHEFLVLVSQTKDSIIYTPCDPYHLSQKRKLDIYDKSEEEIANLDFSSVRTQDTQIGIIDYEIERITTGKRQGFKREGIIIAKLLEFVPDNLSTNEQAPSRESIISSLFLANTYAKLSSSYHFLLETVRANLTKTLEDPEFLLNRDDIFFNSALKSQGKIEHYDFTNPDPKLNGQVNIMDIVFEYISSIQKTVHKLNEHSTQILRIDKYLVQTSQDALEYLRNTETLDPFVTLATYSYLMHLPRTEYANKLRETFSRLLDKPMGTLANLSILETRALSVKLNSDNLYVPEDMDEDSFKVWSDMVINYRLSFLKLYKEGKISQRPQLKLVNSDNTRAIELAARWKEIQNQ